MVGFFLKLALFLGFCCPLCLSSAYPHAPKERDCAFQISEEIEGYPAQIAENLMNSLFEKLSVSSKTKKMKVPKEFVRALVPVLLRHERGNIYIPLTSLTKPILIHCKLDEIANDQNQFAMLVQVIAKWKEEEAKSFEWNPRPNWRSERSGTYVSEKILNRYELELWLNRKGNYLNFDAVAAVVAISRINRTQASISSTVKDLDGNDISIYELIDEFRESKIFDPKGAPDVIPVKDPRTQEWRFATLAHRRLVAAQHAGIREVLVKIHRPGSFLPNREVSNSMKLRMEKAEASFRDFRTGEYRYVKNGFTPEYWGEAVICFCANSRAMNGLSEQEFPNTGLPGLPPLPRRNR
jgi:hypothetical protein